MKCSNIVAALLALVCGSVVLTGCFDDKYDLSNIDTTARVDVDNLIIPVNIDQIRMGNLIHVGPGDRVQIVDGKYAIVDSGTFSSEVVDVAPFNLKSPYIEPSVSTIYLHENSASKLPGGYYALGSYDVDSDPSDFEYVSENIDKAIIDVDSLAGIITIDASVSVTGFESITDIIEFKDVIIQLPAGLHVTKSGGGKYDTQTGELLFPTKRITGSEMTIQIMADVIDFKRVGGKIVDRGNGTRDIVFNGTNYVKSGTVTLVSRNQTAQALPESLVLTTNYTMSAISVTAFSGTIQYDIEGMNINDIKLGNIPDVLSQKGTYIVPVNPRLYMHLNNPVQRYGLQIQSGLDFVSYSRFSDQVIQNILPEFSVGTGNKNGQYNLCIAPQPDDGIKGYEKPVKVVFDDLSYVFATDGVPARISVKLLNPQIPLSHVSNFRLGQNLGNVEGRYRFIAPFDLKDGSTIAYADTVSGWSSDELDRLTVTALDVDLTVNTDASYRLKFTGYPIDSEGNQINNVTVEGAIIDPMAKDQKVTIHITGQVRNLDGVVFQAYAISEGDPKPITPNTNIVLSKVRPRVSGYYQKKL